MRARRIGEAAQPRPPKATPLASRSVASHNGKVSAVRCKGCGVRTGGVVHAGQGDGGSLKKQEGESWQWYPGNPWYYFPPPPCAVVVGWVGVALPRVLLALQFASQRFRMTGICVCNICICL